ncbi:MAG: DUF2293 domain-containing protein [Syntrophobacteraceae bacterium]
MILSCRPNTTCLKYSGRGGRSAATKGLEKETIGLAVIAHIRHTQTSYDRLLAEGWDRSDARRHVNERVSRIAGEWEKR